MTDASALFAKDVTSHRGAISPMDMLKRATDGAKKHPFSLVADFRKIARGPGKLSFEEYVNFRLYDRELYPDNDSRLRFLSDRRHWPLCHQCSPKGWDATTEDKWIAELLLRETGLRTTNTLAVVGGTARTYGRTPHFVDPVTFKSFMAERTAPIFAKVNGGLGSEGATRIVPLGDDQFDVAGLGCIDSARLFSALCAAPAPYLLQDELIHHPEMTALSRRAHRHDPRDQLCHRRRSPHPDHRP